MGQHIGMAWRFGQQRFQHRKCIGRSVLLQQQHGNHVPRFDILARGIQNPPIELLGLRQLPGAMSGTRLGAQPLNVARPGHLFQDQLAVEGDADAFALALEG